MPDAWKSDPPGNLAQGEAIMTNGGGAQTHALGRWGDYTYISIDPSNGMDFWHVNEYYTATSPVSWSTRIGKFNFDGGGVSPTPTATATPTGTPASPTPTATGNADVQRQRLLLPRGRGLLLHRGRVPRRRLGPKACT